MGTVAGYHETKEIRFRMTYVCFSYIIDELLGPSYTVILATPLP
jgi:hypothetical protein